MQCELTIAGSVAATATIRTADTAIDVRKSLCGIWKAGLGVALTMILRCQNGVRLLDSMQVLREIQGGPATDLSTLQDLTGSLQ